MNIPKSFNVFFPRANVFPLIKKGTIALLIVLGIVTVSQQTQNFVNGIGEWFNYHITSPQIKDPNLIVKQINGVSELTNTVFVMDAIVPTSSHRKIGKWVIGETSLLYIARGEVRAGLDLSKITSQHITINENKITIQLPTPEILDSKIDVNKSQVYDYNRGFLNLGPDNAPELQTEAQRQTLSMIKQTACEQEILHQANEKGIMVVRKLMETAGYETVVVNADSSYHCDF